ncbi:TetR/AcrR family transcriptional regulator [Nocardioides lianchengensis]|uniref:DNA-binding transcriptional regulator, AcrR family n=1 Tax=Nocardioides lianchengensis TaxID=1045774 RepID=A0A1G6NU86_9ACTN|nr:TetR/AcrR family transcriptional regulator [Nocardioides lianchengensis]NYG10889.1 AcrR family transcriptional regulator [Nocardioides lianchengensis]SDC71338.1 DNA-binding transcriptional regulator, AcrR family [Nocardioides lianchengensis]
MTPTEAAVQRPRVEGDRELEILAATLAVLADVGYDRLTMDAVATRAKASKATLYRRWTNKVSLVIDALVHSKGPHEVPDTGSLQGDLEAVFCGMGGLVDPETVATFGAVVTALTRDPAFAEAFRRDVLGPKIEASRLIWQRAAERGELRDGLDLDLFEPALAGIVLHRVFIMGETPDPGLITRVIEQIIVPSASRPAPSQQAGTPS